MRTSNPSEENPSSPLDSLGRGQLSRRSVLRALGAGALLGGMGLGGCGDTEEDFVFTGNGGSGTGTGTGGGPAPTRTVEQVVRALSDLRDLADGPEDKDQPIVVDGKANIVPTDASGRAFARSFAEVLRIAYLAPTGVADRGGFFPNGFNGRIRSTADVPANPSIPDVLNFALNLEYVEAEYYLRGLYGSGLTAAEVGPGAGDVNGGRAVNFRDSKIREFITEIGNNERAHVLFLRSTLGDAAVPRPVIDITGFFNAAARLAFNDPNATFDPFSGDLPFAIGAWLFEDVGVTALRGAAPFLMSDPAILEAGAGLLAAEGYHAGELRTLLFKNRAALAA